MMAEHGSRRNASPAAVRDADAHAASDDRPWLVVSDLHLGAVPRETELAFHTFVREAVDTAAGLVINGDLFDLWYSYRHFVPRPHARTMTVLADAVAARLRVVFVGGNRDAAEWDAGALADDIGLEVYPGRYGSNSARDRRSSLMATACDSTDRAARRRHER